MQRPPTDSFNILGRIVPDPLSIQHANRHGLLLGKLTPPDLRGPLVIRDRLFSADGGLPGARVTVIEAPGGYGKTTVMAQWCAYARSLGAAAGWLSFDESDQVEDNFLAGVAAACELARNRSIGSPESDERAMARITPEHVQNLLASIDCETVIFLDDFHLLHLSSAVAKIAGWVQASGPQVSFVIAGRPPVLTAFRSSALASSIAVWDRQMLQFSADDARVVIRDAVPERLIRDLVIRLRGWPAMIRLVSGTAASGGWTDWERYFEKVGGNDAYDYLMEEVYRRLDPVQRLVLETASRLTRITSDVLDYVLRRTDCEIQLRALQEACVLIESTERPEGRIYRLHDLLREFVSRRLAPARSRTVEQERNLSRYYASQNDPQRALYHALEARDLGLVETLMQNMGWRAGLEIGPSMLWRMPADVDLQRRACPQMERAIIYGLLQSSRVAEARRRFQQMRGEHGGMSAFDRSENAVLELLVEHYEDRPLRIERIEALYHEWVAAEGASQPALTLLNSIMRCFAHYDAGHYQQSLELGKVAARMCEEQGLAYARDYLLCFCSLSSIAMSDFGAAEGYLREAEDCAAYSLHSRDLHRHQTMLRIFFAVCHWEAGGEPLPAAEIDRLEATLRDHFDGWPQVFIAFFSVAAEMRAALTGLTDGLAVLERGLAIARDNDWSRVSLQLRSSGVLLCLEYGDTAAARERLPTLQRDLDIRSASSPGADFIADCRAEERLWIAEVWLAFADGDIARGSADGERIVAQLEARNSLLNLALARTLLDLGRGMTSTGVSLSDSSYASQRSSRPWIRLSRLADARGIAVRADAAGAAAPRRPKSQPRRAGTGALSGLTPRERTIAEMIAAGYCLKEISKSLKLSTQTVASYRKACYGKLGISKRSQVCLVLQASREI